MAAKDLLEGLKSSIDEVAAAFDSELAAAKASAAPAPAPVESEPVPAPVADSEDEQAKLDAAVKPFQDRIAALEAQLAQPDSTPFDQAAVDAEVAKATDALKAEYAKHEDDQDAAEESIAQAMKDLADKVAALHAKA